MGNTTDALLKKNIEANEITPILTRGVDIVKVGGRYNISLFILGNFYFTTGQNWGDFNWPRYSSSAMRPVAFAHFSFISERLRGP